MDLRIIEVDAWALGWPGPILNPKAHHALKPLEVANEGRPRQ